MKKNALNFIDFDEFLATNIKDIAFRRAFEEERQRSQARGAKMTTKKLEDDAGVAREARVISKELVLNDKGD